jgi:membrane protein YdbS with pleckstrin-like domain
MTEPTSTAVAWVYEGVWGVLARLFRVPRNPPALPHHDAAAVESFRPAPGYLRYLRLQYWIVIVPLNAVGAAVVAGVTIAMPIAGFVIAVPLMGLVLLASLSAYIAVHLRFDTTWYVLTDRSMRLRRGIWTIRETTITFENAQNVVVEQGPLERLFGIANVVVQTAGGTTRSGPHGEQLTTGHSGVLNGLSDAPRVRDLILAKVRTSRNAGLGDEAMPVDQAGGWSPAHVAMLREIATLAHQLSVRAK